jgi:hypothetical protein
VQSIVHAYNPPDPVLPGLPEPRIPEGKVLEAEESTP